MSTARIITKMWPKIILFGDSHTQRSFDPFNGCWGALLANRFQRIADVINRGFSGYNTRWCRMIMPKVFESFPPADVSCVVIFLGTNDSVPQTSPTKQHVPLDEYQTNLDWMIAYLNQIGIPKERLVLIVPPNLHHDDFDKWCIHQGRNKVPRPWLSNVENYAKACKLLAAQNQIDSIDLYEIFTKIENSKDLFCDGLHLSRFGGQLLYDNLVSIVEKKVENFIQKPLNEAMIFPYWANVNPENLP